MANDTQTSTKPETFGASEFARRVGVSRSKIYRYMSLGLLEPAGKNPSYYFSDEQVAVMGTIHLLMGPLFRFRLDAIRFEIFPEFSQKEVADMATMSSQEVKILLRERNVPC